MNADRTDAATVGPTGDRAGRRGFLAVLAAVAPTLFGVLTHADATEAAAAGAERKRGKSRCPGNRVKIDGRCAPPTNAACDASTICRPFNVVDDQGDQAAACLHTPGSNLCDVTYVCRTNTDCPADELCSRVDCADDFFRCQRMCNDPAVVAASA